MINVVLIRHGEAAAAGAGATDPDRPLTDAGRDGSSTTGRIIAGLGLGEIAVLCSPKLRAKQTAELVATEVGVAEPRVIDCLSGGNCPELILAESGKIARKGTVILVGHEPDMGRLVARLIDPAWGGAIPLPTSGFAWIETDGLPPRKAGRLRRIGSPRDLV